MSGQLKRLCIALIVSLALLPVFSVARPKGVIMPGGLDRASYTSYLQMPGAWRSPIRGNVGRRVPLDRSMLPHIFDQLRSDLARPRQGPRPDTNLTPSATLSEELQPTWAPDPAFELIAFVSNGVDEDGFPGIDPGVTTPDGTYNIWLMRPDGSQQYRLTMDDGANEVDPAFDTGSRLVAFACDKTGTYEIYTIDVGSRVVNQITTSLVVAGNKRHPTWSADRSIIAFQLERGVGNSDIYTMASSGIGQPQPLITNSTNDTDPTFHPMDENLLAYTSERSGAKNIYLYNRGAMTDEQLTNGGGNPNANDKDPAWRATGDMLAFASDRQQAPGDATTEYNIWTMARVGEVVGPPPLLKSNADVGDTEDDEEPAWSPFDIGTPPPGGGKPQIQIVFQSRRPGGQAVNDADIWSVNQFDIVPPIILGMDSGEAMVAEPRLASPGQTVTISVALDDLESGVRGAVCQIKDPDGPLTDAQGLDHHLYMVYPGSPLGGTGGTAWVEYDFETIATVPLRNDGVPPDVDASDKVWTAEFPTPAVPSDYIIDVVTVDEVGNTFEYDNIYGFSTQIFNPQTHVLLVDDHMSSQRFPLLPWSLHFWFIEPSATYYEWNWGGHDPMTLMPELPGIWVHNFGTYGGETAYPWILNYNFWPEHIDVWRIQCRGPIPRHVVDYYGPTTEVQVEPGDFTQPRAVIVSDKCIWWGAPNAGNVYTTRGAITDADTQAELMRFLDRGGRLCVTGEDIGWSLTVDGQYGNPFLNQYLQAFYVSDDLDPINVPHGIEVNVARGGEPLCYGAFGHYT